MTLPPQHTGQGGSVIQRKSRPLSLLWRDPANVEALTKLWNEGRLSASEIAARLGAGFTKNGVIGKAKRLGLGSHAHLTRDPNIQRRAHGLQSKPCRPAPPPPDEPAPIGIVREFTGCRWIHGDGPIDLDGPSCGHDRVPGSSWCPHHAARVVGRGTVTERMAA